MFARLLVDTYTFNSLARRGSETTGLLQQILTGVANFTSPRVYSDFMGSFDEKNRSYSWPLDGRILAGPVGGGMGPSEESRQKFQGGTREVRQLPFEASTFRDICKKFHVYASISRVINRADVPLFSRAEAKMASSGTSHPTLGIHTPNSLLNYCFANVLKSLQLQIYKYLERRPRFNGHIFST
jgi:hypothetical protein